MKRTFINLAKEKSRGIPALAGTSVPAVFCDAVRVQLKTDRRNLQSQAAIERLGAVREGILRKHMLVRDGFIRDTVMYSIVEEEWPAARARLEAKLGAS